ncbi:hypothetical protein [Nocardia blacklockiae]|uniref:hypothetical protein n=1 Tax=Nocardia blacklockiae TaxID=480036 RepID=UPI001893A46A|nr:hypothetical protein [Nocardia blacklockiae]MBF6176648.1 hypothetical protein [Nocardia blacklockiae]
MHYDDGGGNWLELMPLPGGRAVLYGRDHEFSRTFFGEGMERFEETDVLAGVPDWWRDAIDALDRNKQSWGPPVAFAYGFDGTLWQRVEYEATDGFDSLRTTPADGGDFAWELIEEAAAEQDLDHDQDFVIDEAAFDALLTAGRRLTAADLRAALGPVEADIDEGVSAARRFA